MNVIYARNVNDALVKGVKLIKALGRNIDPRGMMTLEVPTPVATVYQNPCERVLLYPERDANPFFHFFESLWILAGWQDVKFLAQFNSKIAEYSDNGVVFHAPYGFRLKYAFGTDQLQKAVDMFKHDHRTRRVALQIWDTNLDLGADSKDIPCNDFIMLKLRNSLLNMTVCCRSNDIIWGCYGANAVQFSVLLEYLAAKIGCHVGTYTQISDSFHAYVDQDAWKRCADLEVAQPYEDHPSRKDECVRSFPLVRNADAFDAELFRFLHDMEDEMVRMFPHYVYVNSFFPCVAIPMYRAWTLYKKKDMEGAIQTLEDECQASDWRKAGTEWLQRRIKN